MGCCPSGGYQRKCCTTAAAVGPSTPDAARKRAVQHYRNTKGLRHLAQRYDGRLSGPTAYRETASTRAYGARGPGYSRMYIFVIFVAHESLPKASGSFPAMLLPTA